MSPNDNKEMIRRIQDAWNAENLEALDQYFTADFDNSQNAVPGGPGGLVGAKAAHTMTRQAMPDQASSIEELVAEGDTVVVRTRTQGTDTGGFSWMGAGPTGRRVTIDSVSVYTFRDGKVAKHWGLNDAFGLALQLGVIPMPGGPPASA